MKKIILLALLVAGLSSCQGVSYKTKLVIETISDTKDLASKPPYGKYRYEFTESSIVFYSDSLYAV